MTGGRRPIFGRAVLRYAPDRYAILGSASNRPPKIGMAGDSWREQRACQEIRMGEGKVLPMSPVNV